MTRRVEAPARLPSNGARKGRGRFPRRLTDKGKRPRNRLLSSRGSSNGRTPALTSEEMSVRIRRPEPVFPNQWGRAVEAARPRIKTPGSSPEAMTTQTNIADSALFFQSPASGRSTDMDRAHEQPFPRKAD